MLITPTVKKHGSHVSKNGEQKYFFGSNPHKQRSIQEKRCQSHCFSVEPGNESTAVYDFNFQRNMASLGKSAAVDMGYERFYSDLWTWNYCVCNGVRYCVIRRSGTLNRARNLAISTERVKFV